MPKPARKKIEDILDAVHQEVEFDPQAQEKFGVSPEPRKLTFPKILDFAFPQDHPEESIAQVGEVVYVGDGIVHVAGLDGATVEEVLDIQTSHGIEKAMILGIQEDRVEAVVLGDYANIKRGDQAKSTNEQLRIPVGKSVLGRVMSPLGEPLDGKGPIDATEYRNVESPAPGVVDRQPIHEPLHTGIMVLDTTIPIGKGQRELVIGDRKTGKSRTMLDIISNQANNNVACIYVGVGIQAAKAKSTYQLLSERGALKYTTMIISLSDDPPSLQYMAPYVGAALGEYYMYRGQDALVVYDDLSKQAKAYRQVSLLLKRSPGRDAYPGDIFFLHSRLLERASKLHDDLKAGSLTALPVAETQSGDVSDYIITNLMSITDGHIYLDANMMNEGILPAVNSGASVSRIGGKVQFDLLQKVGELAGRILARYEEVKSYETINTEVAEETMRDIKRGKRIKEVFNQDSKLNMSPDEEVALLAITTSSRLDHFDLDQSIFFKDNFVDYYRKQPLGDFSEEVREAKKLEEIDKELDRLFEGFCKANNLPPSPKKS